jgi:CrcB protein
MFDFLAVGAGGALGACLRFGLNLLTRGVSGVFPFGTLLSNVAAGFFAGLLLEMKPVKARLFVSTGLLGGLSTFSAFSVETLRLFGGGRYWLAAGNAVLNLSGSLLGAWLGMFLARKL